MCHPSQTETLLSSAGLIFFHPPFLPSVPPFFLAHKNNDVSYNENILQSLILD